MEAVVAVRVEIAADLLEGQLLTAKNQRNKILSTNHIFDPGKCRDFFYLWSITVQ